MNTLPNSLETLPSFNPVSNPPNWNGSKTGLAGYWQWMDEQKRPNGEYGVWKWFDNPQAEGIPAPSFKEVSLKKSKATINMSVSDAWIAGTALVCTGMTIGLIIVILIKI